LISDVINPAISETKEPRIVITVNSSGFDEKEGFQALAGGLGPDNANGPSQDTTGSLLSTIKKYPSVSRVGLCTEYPRNKAQRCKEYILKNAEFVETSSET
jgi:hypothetical protein